LICENAPRIDAERMVLSAMIYNDDSLQLSTAIAILRYVANKIHSR